MKPDYQRGDVTLYRDDIETTWALELGYTNWNTRCRGWLGSTGIET